MAVTNIDLLEEMRDSFRTVYEGIIELKKDRSEDVPTGNVGQPTTKDVWVELENLSKRIGTAYRRIDEIATKIGDVSWTPKCSRASR